ncbi:YhgE/Pip family protein [Microbacterium aurum]
MSWRVFTRDIGRLARARKTWVIVVGVLVTPALYAWFNINAFWDPYSNTSNIGVAVVNLDEGATSDLTGSVDVGAQVVEQLEDNDQLGWQFISEAAAHDAVASGAVYAAIVIPADFSSDLLSITSGEFTQPALIYYVNEKSSAIAPKVTDVGASTLDRQITQAFTEQVAEAATQALKNAGDSAEQGLLTARGDALSALDEAAETIGAARQDIADLNSGLADSRDTLSSARATLDDADQTLQDVQTAIAQAQTIIDEAQQEILVFTDAATSAYVDGVTALANASASVRVSMTDLNRALQQAGTGVDTAIDEVSAVVEANAAAIAKLQEIVDGAGVDAETAQRLTEVISALEQRNQTDQKLLADLKALNSGVADTIAAIQASVDAVDSALTQAQAAATNLRDVLTTSVPGLNRAMSALSAAAGSFSAAVQAQRGQLTQADLLLAGLDTQLASTSNALTSLDGDLASIQDGLGVARTDLVALSAASVWSGLSTLTGLDPEQIAQFIAEPVQVDENVLFPVASYGSAMAALFTNLSLWIGAFVLMVIFKTEVDTERVAGITVRQAYMGRFLLFAMLAVAQALIVCIGNLVIGIQTVSAVAYVGTGVLIALAYVSIIYALCVSFGHVGRGLCILLVIMQIPGASGLYPIEMMPGFFRAIYPVLPFTYGIDAMRETIAGFYGAHYWRFIGTLAVFVALAFLLGLVLRRRLANLNRVFNREIAATDLLIAEDVQITGGGYRLTHILHALSDRQEYGHDLRRRAGSFSRSYGSLLKATVLTGVAGLAVLGVIAWLVPGGKATMLGIWVVWCLLLIAVLVILEYVKQSFESAQELVGMGDAELRQALEDGPRGAGNRTSAVGADAPSTSTPDTPTADAQQLVAEDIGTADPLDGSRSADVAAGAPRDESADEPDAAGPDADGPEADGTDDAEPVEDDGVDAIRSLLDAGPTDEAEPSTPSASGADTDDQTGLGDQTDPGDQAGAAGSDRV